ncbi:sperm microtubule associated protein 2-like isoform X2 [Tubulanus polymorphus]|uniref:sperm microtubule associated protein 2-like isoform X2 n=1 Tax=Tubulanus polymorphus TaxID=672921 RepID=UPI003DA4FB37
MATAGHRPNRIHELSQPKRITKGFIEDRHSVYWVDKLPPKPGPDGVTVCVLTPRQQQLVYNKRVHQDYRGDRPSPIWPVSGAAKKASASAHVENLARHKPVHRQYMYDRPVQTFIPESAKKVEATPRIEALARAKTYHPLPILDLREWDWSDWNERVPKKALSAHCSGRIEDLARAKTLHRDFSANRPIQWDVAPSAQKAQASARITALALAKARVSLNDEYDPYKVPLGAKHCQATPRVQELAVPLPRKCRQKKIV